MGMTHVSAHVTRPDGRGRTLRVRFLVDTGAAYTVLPRRTWRALGLAPTTTLEFGLADGSGITRSIAECRFEIAGRAATSPVVLGERNDAPLFGAVTLETLRLMVNPLTREVVPIRVLPLRPLPAGAPPPA
jgi:aspartyl protease family protein